MKTHSVAVDKEESGLKTLSVLNRVLHVVAILATLIIAAIIVPAPRAQAQPPLKPPDTVSSCPPYDPAKEDPPFCASDARVNPRDAVATMTAYCQQDHSLQVYAIINSNGVFLYTVNAVDIANGLLTAQATGQDILIADQSSRQVWALTSGNLLLHDYAGYNFTFRGDTCGLVAGTVQPVAVRQPAHTRAIPTPRASPVTEPTHHQQLRPSPATETTSASGVVLTSVTTGWLNMRSVPDNKADLIQFVPPYVNIQVIGREIGPTWDWVKISYKGRSGWVSARYCGLTNDDLRKLPALVR